MERRRNSNDRAQLRYSSGCCQSHFVHPKSPINCSGSEMCRLGSLEPCYTDQTPYWHVLDVCFFRVKCKGKAIPLQALTGPEGSRRLRLPDFKTIGTCAAGRIMSMKNSIDTIGNPFSDLPVCSAVPQPLSHTVRFFRVPILLHAESRCVPFFL
jgi:hypothetical protein